MVNDQVRCHHCDTERNGTGKEWVRLGTKSLSHGAERNGEHRGRIKGYVTYCILCSGSLALYSVHLPTLSNSFRSHTVKIGERLRFVVVVVVVQKYLELLNMNCLIGIQIGQLLSVSVCNFLIICHSLGQWTTTRR